jgi:Zn-dependent protease/CBS domain-containing protein
VGGFRLGRVLGVEVRVDYSWFIICFLILWSFTSGVFPARAPGLPRAIYVAMGIGGAILFFASLLGHELSHAIVARRKGIPVEGITLFIFGGIAHTRSEAQTPGDEFQIAGIGPVTSLLIALVLGGLWYAGANAGWPAALLIVLEYIAALNVALAVFNLLPGFPLDGGRIFRSLVWKATGSLTRATKWATRSGQGLAYALIAWGIWLAVGGDLVSGIWLVFIGWFLRNAAVASMRQLTWRDSLITGSARQAMTPVPETVPAALSVQQLVEDYFQRRRFVSYAVEDAGRPVGIVTVDQVKAIPPDTWPTMRVRDAMAPATADLVVAPEENMIAVIEKLRRSPVQRVLVLHNGELEGIITVGDVNDWLGKMRASAPRR